MNNHSEKAEYSYNRNVANIMDRADIALANASTALREAKKQLSALRKIANRDSV